MDKIFNLDGKLMQTMNKFADIMFLNVITLICCIPIITIGPAITAMHYVLLKMFRNGFGVDETVFYFNDDKEQREHYIGYISKYDKPYWAVYCDIDNGVEFKTADELFNAKIYDGKSIKDRWEQIVLTEIGGLSIE